MTEIDRLYMIVRSEGGLHQVFYARPCKTAAQAWLAVWEFLENPEVARPMGFRAWKEHWRKKGWRARQVTISIYKKED